MGLDMYLNAKKYIGSNDEVKVEGLPEAAFMKLKWVTYEGMYWRKANAIHAWFVDNVQNGVDDCKEYYVDNKKLEELMNHCATVIADPSQAEELLPTQSGFFFGETAYGDWYIENLKATYEGLKELLAQPMGPEWSFFYESSW